jgi:ADP-heptose:LPS heptosyltransferase
MLSNLDDIKNILVVRNDRFGEFLLNIPALRALKETFIQSKLIAVVNPYVRELAASIPFIDEIMEWESGRHSFSEKLRLIGVLRKKCIDIAIMLNPSKDFNIFTFLSGIPVRVGYARKWGFLLTHKIADKKYLGRQHEVEYNLKLVSLIGAKTEDKSLSLSIANGRIEDLLKELKIENQDNLVAVHPWTSDPIKQWPAINFRALADRLLKELDLKIVIIGGKDELARGRELFNDLEQDRLINLTAKTTLKQLALILKKCKLLISADSGPVHLAACVGTPVVAIFRNDIPAKSALRWGPRSKGSVVIQKSTLEDITVLEVFDKAREVLKR